RQPGTNPPAGRRRSGAGRWYRTAIALEGPAVHWYRTAIALEGPAPLYPHDFLTVIGLLAVMVVLTVVSLLTAGRWAMVGATAAAVGLIGYTLYIPRIGQAPGFGPYGSSYWISLAAAVVMALAAGVGAMRTPRASTPPHPPPLPTF